MATVRYQNVKFWRSLCIPLAALISLAGGLIVWVNFSYLNEVAPIELAALANAGDQLNIDPKTDPVIGRDSFESEVQDDFDKWILTMQISSVTATFIIVLLFGYNQLYAVSKVQEARRKCLDIGRNNIFSAEIRNAMTISKDEGMRVLEEWLRKGGSEATRQIAEANNIASFVKWGYYIAIALIFASLALAGTVLVWATVNFVNTEDGNNDYYFFLLVVVGMSVAAVGHIIAIAISVYLAMASAEICTVDKIISLNKMPAARQEKYVNGFAGMTRGGTTRRRRRSSANQRTAGYGDYTELREY